jgi:hypothetical protein
MEILTTNGLSNSDPFLEDQFGFTVFHTMTGMSWSFEWLRRHEIHMLLNLSTEETWNLLWSRIMNFGTMTTNSMVFMIRECIPNGKVTKTLAKSFAPDSPLFPCGSILSIIAQEWIHCKEIMESEHDEEWETFLLQFLGAGADLHAVSTNTGVKHTILLSLVYATLLLAQRVHVSWPTWVLRKWLHIISKAGVDLMKYGQTELDMHRWSDVSWHFDIDLQTRGNSEKDWCTTQIFRIHIGERPEDWDIEWDNLVLDGVLREFWDLVDGPPSEDDLKVPGGWYDE